MRKELKFELSEPIEFHENGDVADSNTIVLYAPSRKQLRYCTSLKQYFYASVRNIGANEEPEVASRPKKDDMTGEEVMTMMYLSGGADMNGVLDEAMKLFNSGVAQINGVIPLTSAHLDSLSIDDIERMLGEYMVNFILVSFLLSMKEG